MFQKGCRPSPWFDGRYYLKFQVNVDDLILYKDTMLLPWRASDPPSYLKPMMFSKTSMKLFLTFSTKLLIKVAVLPFPFSVMKRILKSTFWFYFSGFIFQVYHSRWLKKLRFNTLHGSSRRCRWFRSCWPWKCKLKEFSIIRSWWNWQIKPSATCLLSLPAA